MFIDFRTFEDFEPIHEGRKDTRRVEPQRLRAKQSEEKNHLCQECQKRIC